METTISSPSSSAIIIQTLTFILYIAILIGGIYLIRSIKSIKKRLDKLENEK
ncbi:hypothetical protein QX233_17550 [Chryseobacterium gambrini]|uniref:Uncharacterized protein n=1 Tax=Chryseobacterium gambrini TaxID=373672 RepID=A0AAJ1R5G3_9FLAO|nr:MULTISPECIES: hypothetical protein [Chryseobacterium]MDN4014280.1 hypothetical protein [Chryseobacterium gambrini]MDN4029759.1 hypothetical protein [Chryseobacterium gambrini]QWA37192.1 hypothetical protein KKI44_14775 [Chryseobacterium sp. ZHDP1]